MLKNAAEKIINFISTPSGSIRALLILLCFSAILRAILLVLTPENVFFHNDGHEYMDISRQIAHGKGFSVSYRRWYEAVPPEENGKIHTDYSRTPLFPLLGAPLFFLPCSWITAAKTVCWLLSLLAIYAVFLTAKEAAGRSIGFLTALIFSFYPYNLYYTICWSTEMLFLVFLTFSIYFLLLACKKRFFFLPPCFLMLALAVLTRPTAILLFPIFLALVVWRLGGSWKKYFHTLLQQSIIGTLIFIAVLLPWAIRNGIHTGVCTPLCFYNHYVFWLSNSEIIEKTYQTLDTPAYKQTVDESWERLHKEKLKFLGDHQAYSLIEANPFWKKWGQDQIKENPGRFLYLLKERFFHYWRMCPNLIILTPAKIILLRIFFLTAYLFSIIGLWIYRKHFYTCVMLLLPLFGLAVSVPFLFVLRYRFPFFAPYLCFFCAIGIVWVLRKLCAKRINDD